MKYKNVKQKINPKDFVSSLNEQTTGYGIYAIYCTENNKIYIGHTKTSFNHRINDHKSRLRKGIHKNLHMQRAFEKYGEECFKFYVIEKHSKRDTRLLSTIEKRYVESFEKIDLFNIVLDTVTKDLANKQSEEFVNKRVEGYKKSCEARDAVKVEFINYFIWFIYYLLNIEVPTFDILRSEEYFRKCERKLNKDDIAKIKTNYLTGKYSVNKLAKLVNVSSHTMSEIIREEKWEWVEPKINGYRRNKCRGPGIYDRKRR